MRNATVDLSWRARVVERDLAQELVAVVAGEGGLEREQLVERDAEGVDVAAVVDDDALGEGLLGAHVAERAEEVAGHRHAGVLFDAGQAEVGDPEFAGVVDQQVGRLDVAVEDAVLVGVVEGFGGLDAEVGDGAEVVAGGEGGELGARSMECGRALAIAAVSIADCGFRIADSRAACLSFSSLRAPRSPLLAARPPAPGSGLR